MNRHGKQYVTANDKIKFLKVYHKDLWPISETSIRRLLKNNFDMKYLKALKKSIKTASNNYTRGIFETILIVGRRKKGIGILFTLMSSNIMHTPLISTTGATKTLKITY